MVCTMREYIVWVVKDDDGYRGMYQWTTSDTDAFPGEGEAKSFETYDLAVHDVIGRVKSAMLAEPDKD